MGEIAALATSILWSFTSIQFTLAGRRVGAETVNRIRLVLAVVLLSAVHLVFYGRAWPAGVPFDRWRWLGLSGIVGLVIGDGCLFRAFVLIGPRRSMLLMTLSPVVSTLLAWAWFGETLLWFEIAAIVVTIGGIAWVVSETQTGTTLPPMDGRRQVLGSLYGLGGAVGQSVGLILSKHGLAGGFSPLSATLMRLIVASVGIWLLALVRGQVGGTRQALRDGKAWWFIVGGVATGPTAGVFLSMVAVQYAHVGIASTLMALSPIMLIPLTRWVLAERASSRAISGTVVALAGAAALIMT
jgi:drug/metabolite transporter (DMT)-like permease